MPDAGLWRSFDEAYCLTLEGDVARQRHASAELCRVGLDAFKFVEGVRADSDEVRAAYAEGLVKTFPPCFRCAATRCGDSQCNNVLIEPQVGCFLSFIKIFRRAAASSSRTFLVVEDDVMLLEHYAGLAELALAPEMLEPLGFFSDEPCLLGLGRGSTPGEAFTPICDHSFIPRRKLPQNPCFAFNRAFADLALSRFQTISHTADIFIHFDVADEARHYSLEPPLASELSSSTGALPSRIHPKAVAASNPDNSDEERRTAETRLLAHRMHVHVTPLLVLGSPRGGTGYMAHALAAFGLDVGHESMGADGISSWLFAVSDTDLPFGEPGFARQSKFVHPEQTIAVVRTNPKAIAALQLENSKNIQSYAFRRRWIRQAFDIEIDRFSSDFERALASYVFWYRLVALRNPAAWVGLERASTDLLALWDAGVIVSPRRPEPSELDVVVNARKPYHGQVYNAPAGDFDEQLCRADPFLVDAYKKLRLDLGAAFGDPP